MLLQAASGVKLVDATLLACDNKGTQRKSWGLLNGRQGEVLQENLGLTCHKSIDLVKTKIEEVWLTKSCRGWAAEPQELYHLDYSSCAASCKWCEACGCHFLGV